jgi:hypothetical protein
LTHPRSGSGCVVEQFHEITDDNVEHVLHCAEIALAEGQTRRGPPPRKTLRIMIEQLATLFEEATGRAFTHTPYVKTKYKGIPQSHAGRFVTAFLKIVELKSAEWLRSQISNRSLGTLGLGEGNRVPVDDIGIEKRPGESRNWDAVVANLTPLVLNELRERVVEPLRGTYQLG